MDERGGKILSRGGKRVARGSTPPPCHQCPKKSPEQAHEYELSERNIKMYEMYLKSQATSGLCLGDLASDPMVQRDFAVIHNISTTIQNNRFEMALMKSGLRGMP